MYICSIKYNFHLEIEAKSSPDQSTVLPLVATIEQIEPCISKVECDQEIQRYYRDDLIQHFMDWPSIQLEKQA